MNTGLLFVVATICAGAMIASQGIINGRMSAVMGGPVQAALISFAVGFMALLALNIALGHRPQSGEVIAGAPWWAWIGGLMGAVVVSLAAAAVPRIGVATYVSAFIAGQLTAAVIYDHFGFLGQQVREITPLRLLGIGLMALGVYFIRRF